VLGLQKHNGNGAAVLTGTAAVQPIPAPLQGMSVAAMSAVCLDTYLGEVLHGAGDSIQAQQVSWVRV
jgi:hypothetical protein